CASSLCPRWESLKPELEINREGLVRGNLPITGTAMTTGQPTGPFLEVRPGSQQNPTMDSASKDALSYDHGMESSSEASGQRMPPGGTRSRSILPQAVGERFT